MRRLTTQLLAACMLLATMCTAAHAGVANVANHASARILIFTGTAGFRHDSIPEAARTLAELARAQGLAADRTDQAGAFTDTRLRRYRAVVFAQTTGDVLDDAQQGALERFVRAGGGFMGVHAAADTEYDWPWYGDLVGARFLRHPPGLQQARITRLGKREKNADVWTVRDELYQYRAPLAPSLTLLARIDQRDDDGPVGAAAPIGWCQRFDGGRSWYTGLGHDIALYRDPRFLDELRHGLAFASGQSASC